MCLRLLYLFTTRLFAWVRLSRREASWQSAEILLLRHQLTVLRRNVSARPTMTWADRALIAALVGLIPKARRAGLDEESIEALFRDVLRSASERGVA